MASSSSPLRTVGLTSAALTCFAANSLLCRMALKPGHIDAASFMTLRLASGALVLAAISRRSAPPAPSEDERSRWIGALWLFLYAVAFSFAYLRLSAGAGALILFGVVQATMVCAGLWSGERLRALEGLGMLLALGGLVALTLPGLAAPDPRGAGLMAAAGIGWAAYSLRGRKASRPVVANAASFLRAVPLSMAACALGWRGAHLDLRGVLLAVASGGLASGIGYSLWYAALPSLSTTRAAIVQLTVPVLAAAAAVILLSESLSPRLLGAGSAILGGVALAILARGRAPG
jgi:drug/metabolite transporter (DMT)-like permease